MTYVKTVPFEASVTTAVSKFDGIVRTTGSSAWALKTRSAPFEREGSPMHPGG